MKSSNAAGGLNHGLHEEFLFTPIRAHERPKLLGGVDDDTGGSSSSLSARQYSSFLGESGDKPFLVLWCSFVEGVDRGLSLPLLFTLKNRYALSQFAASAVIAVSLAPWMTKPLLGLVTDTVPIFQVRRKYYILGSAGINAAALSLIAYSQAHLVGGILVPLSLMVLRTFSRAMIDSAAQGLLLEDCREEQTVGSDQARTTVMVSRFQASHRLGQILSVCSSAFFLSQGTLTPIYLSIAALHVGTVLFAWSTQESPVNTPHPTEALMSRLPEKLNQLTLAVASSQPFRNVLEYAFLSVAIPSFEAPMTYYLLDARHFSLSDISFVNIVMTSGSLIAPVVYAHFFKTSKYSTLMTALTVASVPASLTPLLITTGFAAHHNLNEVAIASFSAFTVALINDLQILPAHVLVAQLAPRGLEGSSLSVLTLVLDAGRVISAGISSTLPMIVGAAAPKYKRMSLYIALCTLFNVGPISAIDGFDVAVEPIKIDEQDRDIPTLGGVIKELQRMDPASPMSLESDVSPTFQVNIQTSPPQTN